MGAIPEKAGLYWARMRAMDQRYNMIVRVCGEAPFLRVEEVYCFYGNGHKGPKPPFHSHNMYFGPKIKVPKLPKEELEEILNVRCAR